MTRAMTRTVSLTTLLTMALTLVAVGPVAASDTAVKRVPSAERYALSLLNCTRTGGSVKVDGTCVGRASGKYSPHRPPVRLHKGISTRVAWPWARAMVLNNVCDHAIAGKPVLSQRMRSKGFRVHFYGENVGCAWGTGDARAVVLGAHRAMQAEKASRGGHWKNIKNPGYKSVGIGVATRNGRTMVVWDYYGKRY